MKNVKREFMYMVAEILHHIAKLCLKFIVWHNQDSRLVKHAKNEFNIAWFNGKDDSGSDIDEDGLHIQKAICKDIVEMLSVLSMQGDSGFSIKYKQNILNKCIDFDTLSKLTLDMDEFYGNYFLETINIGSENEKSVKIYQNKRNSKIFMHDDGGKQKYTFVDDLIFNEAYRIKNVNNDLAIESIKDRNSSYRGGTATFIITRDGDIYNKDRGFIKDMGSFSSSTHKFGIDVYTIEHPEDWWVHACKEDDLINGYGKKYDIVKMDDERQQKTINSEIFYKDGIHTDEILNRLEIAGKHMYGDSFVLKLKKERDNNDSILSNCSCSPNE